MGAEPVLETPKNVFNVSKRQRYYIFNAIILKMMSVVYSDGIDLHRRPLLSEVTSCFSDGTAFSGVIYFHGRHQPSVTSTAVCDVTAISTGIFMPLVTSSDFLPSVTSSAFYSVGW